MDSPFSYVPENRLLIIVGNFGSGKTEVSVNLALKLAESRRVEIVDLDIVNPYFRCREAREEMESKGIRVTYPKGEFHSADLPIVLPEVKGAVVSDERYVIFDVGGDDLGARVLSSLADILEERPYSMLQVINACRPFTRDVEGCLRIMAEIEEASRMKVTGFIANTHLMDETDEKTFMTGLDLAKSVANESGKPLAFATIDRKLLSCFKSEEAGCPLLPVDRRMLPPWRLGSFTDRANRILKDNGS